MDSKMKSSSKAIQSDLSSHGQNDRHDGGLNSSSSGSNSSMRPNTAGGLRKRNPLSVVSLIKTVGVLVIIMQLVMPSVEMNDGFSVRVAIGCLLELLFSLCKLLLCPITRVAIMTVLTMLHVLCSINFGSKSNRIDYSSKPMAESYLASLPNKLAERARLRRQRKKQGPPWYERVTFAAGYFFLAYVALAVIGASIDCRNDTATMTSATSTQPVSSVMPPVESLVNSSLYALDEATTTPAVAVSMDDGSDTAIDPPSSAEALTFGNRCHHNSYERVYELLLADFDRHCTHCRRVRQRPKRRPFHSLLHVPPRFIRSLCYVWEWWRPSLPQLPSPRHTRLAKFKELNGARVAKPNVKTVSSNSSTEAASSATQQGVNGAPEPSPKDKNRKEQRRRAKAKVKEASSVNAASSTAQQGSNRATDRHPNKSRRKTKCRFPRAKEIKLAPPATTVLPPTATSTPPLPTDPAPPTDSALPTDPAPPADTAPPTDSAPPTNPAPPAESTKRPRSPFFVVCSNTIVKACRVRLSQAHTPSAIHKAARAFRESKRMRRREVRELGKRRMERGKFRWEAGADVTLITEAAFWKRTTRNIIQRYRKAVIEEQIRIDLELAVAIQASEADDVDCRKLQEREDFKLALAIQASEVDAAAAATASSVLSAGECGLIYDTGANMTTTGFEEDFVDGTLQDLDRPSSLHGIKDGTHFPISKVGIVRYELRDEGGRRVVLETVAFFVPGLGRRILSHRAHGRYVEYCKGERPLLDDSGDVDLMHYVFPGERSVPVPFGRQAQLYSMGVYGNGSCVSPLDESTTSHIDLLNFVGSLTDGNEDHKWQVLVVTSRPNGDSAATNASSSPTDSQSDQAAARVSVSPAAHANNGSDSDAMSPSNDSATGEDGDDADAALAARLAGFDEEDNNDALAAQMSDLYLGYDISRLIHEADNTQAFYVKYFPLLKAKKIDTLALTCLCKENWIDANVVGIAEGDVKKFQAAIYRLTQVAVHDYVPPAVDPETVRRPTSVPDRVLRPYDVASELRAMSKRLRWNPNFTVEQQATQLFACLEDMEEKGRSPATMKILITRVIKIWDDRKQWKDLSQETRNKVNAARNGLKQRVELGRESGECVSTKPWTDEDILHHFNFWDTDQLIALDELQVGLLLVLGINSSRRKSCLLNIPPTSFGVKVHEDGRGQRYRVMQFSYHYEKNNGTEEKICKLFETSTSHTNPVAIMVAYLHRLGLIENPWDVYDGTEPLERKDSGNSIFKGPTETKAQLDALDLDGIGTDRLSTERHHQLTDLDEEDGKLPLFLAVDPTSGLPLSKRLSYAVSSRMLAYKAMLRGFISSSKNILSCSTWRKFWCNNQQDKWVFFLLPRSLLDDPDQLRRWVPANIASPLVPMWMKLAYIKQVNEALNHVPRFVVTEKNYTKKATEILDYYDAKHEVGIPQQFIDILADHSAEVDKAWYRADETDWEEAPVKLNAMCKRDDNVPRFDKRVTVRDRPFVDVETLLKRQGALRPPLNDGNNCTCVVENCGRTFNFLSDRECHYLADHEESDFTSDNSRALYDQATAQREQVRLGLKDSEKLAENGLPRHYILLPLRKHKDHPGNVEFYAMTRNRDNQDVLLKAPNSKIKGAALWRIWSNSRLQFAELLDGDSNVVSNWNVLNKEQTLERVFTAFNEATRNIDVDRSGETSNSQAPRAAVHARKRGHDQVG
jgi:hypothetical protein